MNNVAHTTTSAEVSKNLTFKKLANLIIDKPIVVERLLVTHGYALPKPYSVKELNSVLAKAIADGNVLFLDDLNKALRNNYNGIDPITISAIIGGLTSLTGGLLGKKSKSENQQELEQKTYEQILAAQKEKEKQKKYLIYVGIGFFAFTALITTAIVLANASKKQS